MNEHLISVLANIGMISFIGLSAWLLLKAGLVSFGQQAFFGIGAYAAGIATAVWQLPVVAGLAFGIVVAAAAALLLGATTRRLHGLYFSIASFAFAEICRLGFELFRYRVERGGEAVGPDGVNGFNEVRALFAAGFSPLETLALVWGLLLTCLAVLGWFGRARAGLLVDMVGEDETAAALQGVDVARLRVVITGVAGGLAGLGGGLYVHLTTYVEPRLFDAMLGVHALAYGLIGGLGTAIGPVLGAVIDIGLLESSRLFAGYRMIVFGGLVAVLVILRPRGLLDEQVMRRIRRAFHGHAGTGLARR